MKYYKVPSSNGVLDIDYADMLEGFTISETTACVSVVNAELRESWQELSEIGYNQEKDKLGILAKTVIITGEKVIRVNVAIPISIEVQYPKGVTDVSEIRPLVVKITGPGQPAELTINPVNGQAEFDFESPIPGTFTIQATADFPCDPGTLEVTVNG